LAVEGPAASRPLAPRASAAAGAALRGSQLDACYHVLKVATDATYLLDQGTACRSRSVQRCEMGR